MKKKNNDIRQNSQREKPFVNYVTKKKAWELRMKDLEDKDKAISRLEEDGWIIKDRKYRIYGRKILPM
jgi:chaperonin cofactor prefoldin